MRLNDFQQLPDDEPYTYDTRDDIDEWFYQMEIKTSDYVIHDDMSVSGKRTIDLSEKNLTRIPVKFKEIKGSFYLDGNPLTTLLNCPEIVTGNFSCIKTQITSLEHAPKKVGLYDENFVVTYNDNLTSLTKIHKYVKSVKHTFIFDIGTTHVLGLLKIQGLQHIVVREEDGSAWGSTRYVSNLERILNEHLAKRDELLCQNDLIAAGYIEEARR